MSPIASTAEPLIVGETVMFGMADVIAGDYGKEIQAIRLPMYK